MKIEGSGFAGFVDGYKADGDNKQPCTQCESIKAEVERLKADKQKLLDALRPVAVCGNRLMSCGSLNKYEFLAPSGYRKAYEVYNEVTK